jgi:hypothetical protein
MRLSRILAFAGLTSGGALLAAACGGADVSIGDKDSGCAPNDPKCTSKADGSAQGDGSQADAAGDGGKDGGDCFADGGPGGATFACADVRCSVGTEYCRKTVSGGGVVGTCLPLPCTCVANPSCQCLQPYLKCPNNGNPSCYAIMGGLFLSCPGDPT